MLLIKPKKNILTICFLSMLSACGGGEISESNNSFGQPGATPASGEWNVQAKIAINADGAITNIEQESTISVNANGTASISATDTECSIRVNFNGSTINYQTTCLVNTEANSCTLTFTGFAAISRNAASGSFNPETVICSNASASYTGNITASRNIN